MLASSCAFHLAGGRKGSWAWHEGKEEKETPPLRCPFYAAAEGAAGQSMIRRREERSSLRLALPPLRPSFSLLTLTLLQPLPAPVVTPSPLPRLSTPSPFPPLPTLPPSLPEGASQQNRRCRSVSLRLRYSSSLGGEGRAGLKVTTRDEEVAESSSLESSLAPGSGSTRVILDLTLGRGERP